MADKMRNNVEDKHRVSKILWTLYCLFLVASLAVIVKIVYIQSIWEPDIQTIKEFLPDNKKEIVKPERGNVLQRQVAGYLNPSLHRKDGLSDPEE